MQKKRRDLELDRRGPDERKEKKQPYPCTRAAGSVLTGPGQGPGRQVRSEPCQSIQVDPSIRSVRQTKK